MSDEGEKTCPLCAEEMDLTDQQLKPCKCGYDICVWCWHHIMDMAEKDNTEGRCPACRSSYDKEKIVGTAGNCERLVAEVNFERKMKSQKAKSKSTEGRKQLSSVRVIQRNLVYIVGLPLDLADEELLQRREYFGQYGKVLKVSMSRTATGVIQQFPNNTCSVYITYSKEEEAIRCIQSVHGFVLDGRSLKACFGTTKYCHAWLRNVPCTNPDCLYLHEVGSQEDSFTKDEIVSAYTRVQQITGTTNNLPRVCSGNVLPPPLDDYCPHSSVSTARPIPKNPPNNAALSISRGSPPNGSSGRSVGLPAGASWGMRASNQHPPACSNGPSKQKPDLISSTLPFSSPVSNTAQVSTLPSDTINIKSKPDSFKPLKQNAGLDCRTTAVQKSSAPDVATASKSLSSQLSYVPHDQPPSMSSTVLSSNDSTPQSIVKEGSATMDGKIHRLSSDMSSLDMDGNVSNAHSSISRPISSDSEHGPGQRLQQYYASHDREALSSPANVRSMGTIDGVNFSRDQLECRTDSQTEAVENSSSDVEEDILSFDNQRLKDPEVNRSTNLLNSASPFYSTNHSRSRSLQHNEPFNVVDNIFVDDNLDRHSFLHGSSVSAMSNGYPDKFLSSNVGSDVSGEGSFLLSSEMNGMQMGRYMSNDQSGSVKDTGESSIISNILSLDFDTWDEPLTSPQNLAKLLGDTDKPTLKISSSWKAQNNGQSRFSFARQEDSNHQLFNVEPSFGVSGQMAKSRSFSQDFADNRDAYLDKFGIHNGFSSQNSFEDGHSFTGSSSVFSSNKLSAIPRAQVSAPPGFAIPSRAPPPGFSSHERVDQSFDSAPGNHLVDSSSHLRNSYQMAPGGNTCTSGDIEFMDPAILAVGKGRLQGGPNDTGFDMRSNFPSQLSAFENEARLQLLMQRSLHTQQNLRYTDAGDNFSSLSSYGLSSRVMDQAPMSNMSPFAAQLSLPQTRNSHMSNGHWDGWNEVQGGNNMGITELLRNERLGYNKFYSGYDESKFRMPSSGDLYNRTFGM